MLAGELLPSRRDRDRGGGALLRDMRRAAPRAQRVAAAGESGISRPGPRPAFPVRRPAGSAVSDRQGSSIGRLRAPSRPTTPLLAFRPWSGVPWLQTTLRHSRGVRGRPAESGPADVARPLRGARRRNDWVRRARFQRPRRALPDGHHRHDGRLPRGPAAESGRQGVRDRPNLDRRRVSAVHAASGQRCTCLASCSEALIWATCASMWEGDEWTRRSAEWPVTPSVCGWGHVGLSSTHYLVGTGQQVVGVDRHARPSPRAMMALVRPFHGVEIDPRRPLPRCSERGHTRAVGSKSP